MKVFKSLNCIVCELPFAPIANQPRSPRDLGCGKMACHECCEREKSTKNEERKHQCWMGNICFSSPNFAYFLIDILSQDSLKFSPMDHGYLLCKPFHFPKCPSCDDAFKPNLQYSNTCEGKTPFCLKGCGHIICTSCHEKTRHLNEGSDKDRWHYKIKCPICSMVTGTNAEPLEEYCQARFHSKIVNFLNELPEMTRQLEEMGTTTCRFCKECKKGQPIDDLFYCEECEENICGTCAVKKHKSHTTPTILDLEATRISDRLRKLSRDEINTYKNLFPELHNKLIDDIGTFETKLLSKEEDLKLASNYEDLQRKHEKCIKLKTDFETICEEYMPHLRQCDTKVKDLIKSLDDDTN